MNEEVWKCKRKSVLLLTTLFERKNDRSSRKISESHSCGKMRRKNLTVSQKKWGENAFFGRKPLFFCSASWDLPVGFLIALENIFIASAGRIRMSADSLILSTNSLIKTMFSKSLCGNRTCSFSISRDSRYRKIRLLLTNLFL